MIEKETAYWIALAHLKGWSVKKRNQIAREFHFIKKVSIIDFFHASPQVWKDEYVLTDTEIKCLQEAMVDLPNLAFLAESMASQGYEIIPLVSTDYSLTLGKNLTRDAAPTILYVKGNKHLLKQAAVAIVGSRAASMKALQFTDCVAESAVDENKVIVSGFAKGVDKQALDSALRFKGSSIIVLPQGILTFNTGFKTYYKNILEGKVLVVSTFFPKAPWQKELAMARNPIIYGLADEIFVAESDNKGGTWSGVIDGLRRGRAIFVRKSSVDENNANNLLIEKGATPLSFDLENKEFAKVADVSSVSDKKPFDINLVEQILLSKKMAIKDIKNTFDIQDSDAVLRNKLETISGLKKEKKGNLNIYWVEKTLDF